MKAEPEDAVERSPQVWLGPAQEGGSQGSTHLSPVIHQVLLWPLAHFILLTMQHQRTDAGTQEGFTEFTPTLDTSFCLLYSAGFAQACLVARVVGPTGSSEPSLADSHRCGLGWARESVLTRTPRDEMGNVRTCSDTVLVFRGGLCWEVLAAAYVSPCVP